MHDHNSDAPDELETVLQAAGLLVGRGVQPAEFLEWYRKSVPAMAPRFTQTVSAADGGSDALIYGMGRALWVQIDAYRSPNMSPIPPGTDSSPLDRPKQEVNCDSRTCELVGKRKAIC